MKIHTGRGVTTLTIPNLFKDDEGLYKIRLVTKGGTAEHSAFVSVSGNGIVLGFYVIAIDYFDDGLDKTY